jgi:hypothetical protein|tara:strand:- start:1359 stop:1745 length:387 start_codon:yes stop_codon:yes gene_type:complete
MKGTAKKKDPAKWARAKARAKAKMGGKHSARAMQLAVKYYKDAGGRYSGKKSSGNKLKKWGDQKWDYVSKGDKKKPKSKRGRYLPKSVRESLTPSEKASTNRAKRVANARSRRKAKYSKSIARKVRNA